MTPAYPLTLLYDSACPVCALEMDHLRARDRQGLLAFVDIAQAGFDPAPYGATLAEMNAQIHGIGADGRVFRGLEVLRMAYDAAGLGWALRPTAWPPLRRLADVGYLVFARHRQAISRVAGPLILALRRHRARRVEAQMRRCAEGVCPRRPS